MGTLKEKVGHFLVVSAKEIFAGIVMFVSVLEAIVYFKLYAKVNFGNFDGYFFALVLSMFIGTFVCGLITGIPIVVSCGISINTFLFVTVLGQTNLGFSYQNVLFFLLIDGFIFFIFSLFGKNGLIYSSIPEEIRHGIPIVVGLIIIMNGFDMAIGTTNNQLATFTIVITKNWQNIFNLIFAIFTLLGIIFFKRKNTKIGMFLSIVIFSIIYGLLERLIFKVDIFAGLSGYSFNEASQLFKSDFLFSVFDKGYDFSTVVEKFGNGKTIFISIGISLTLLLYIIYASETASISAIKAGELLIPERKNISKRVALSASCSTMIGAIFGAPCITISEMSICGCEENGKTRLSSLTTSLLLLLLLFIYPLLSIVPSCVVAAMIIYAGLKLSFSVKDVEWAKLEEGIPITLMIAAVTFTKNIVVGLGIGFVSYIVLCLFKKEGNKVSPLTWIMAILFLVCLIISF